MFKELFKYYKQIETDSIYSGEYLGGILKPTEARVQIEKGFNLFVISK